MRNQEAELVRLTQQCWQHYWQLDVDFILGHCDENVTWIGAEQDEFIRNNVCKSAPQRFGYCNYRRKHRGKNKYVSIYGAGGQQISEGSPQLRNKYRLYDEAGKVHSYNEKRRTNTHSRKKI